MHTKDTSLLTTKQAARLLRLSPQTLEKWRTQGVGPNFVKLGNKSVRYCSHAIEAFIDGGRNED
ncbi:AlpA family transcriptional regulator [Ruegeria sp. HKCCD6604]|uniref:helix-turn-helix transcriptional regulator n=1 Tax=Ruegeria sp. HKCCD6604 TaxID=2683000 RepID=UPI00149131F3|nr:helix-turn-helix domain-containing protein [Ruegeria sp. HKCCD6604]NOC91929.1 helix-turn-helix domain-containing protein [Ruegeria sp. HKCCD6604]